MPKNRRTIWFGIRSIYIFGKKKNRKTIFEERVVVFSANTAMKALVKAQKEADRYAATNNKMKRHPWLEVYEAYTWEDVPLIDGYEVWSELFESFESLGSFVKSRYERYRYHPDP